MPESRVLLRRFLPVHVSGKGKISPEAFLCREGEEGLSFTLLMPDLDGPELQAFQLANELASRALPGICKVPLAEVKGRSRLNLRHDPQPAQVRGDLHHLTDCPDEGLRAELALRGNVALYPVSGKYR